MEGKKERRYIHVRTHNKADLFLTNLTNEEHSGYLLSSVYMRRGSKPSFKALAATVNKVTQV